MSEAGRLVLFADEVCDALGISRRTMTRLRRFRAFPIPELPALDKRPRWSRAAIDAYLVSHAPQSTRRQPSRHLKQVEQRSA